MKNQFTCGNCDSNVKNVNQLWTYSVHIWDYLGFTCSNVKTSQPRKNAIFLFFTWEKANVHMWHFCESIISLLFSFNYDHCWCSLCLMYMIKFYWFGHKNYFFMYLQHWLFFELCELSYVAFKAAPFICERCW